MKSGKKLTKILIVMNLVFLSLILFCVQMKKNNPLLPDYQGDYKLSIAWKSLPAVMETGKEYRIACLTGVDTFTSFSVPDSQKQFLDTTRLAKSTNDTIMLYFVKEFHDSLSVLGVRPNGLKVHASALLRVVNPARPFVIVPQQISVGSGNNFIPITITNTTGNAVWIYWKIKSTGNIDSIKQPVSPGTIQLPITISQSTGWDTLIVWSKDVANLFSDTVTIALRINGYVPKVTDISFPASINCGDTLSATLVFGESPASTFRMVVQGIGNAYVDTSLPQPYQSQIIVKMKKPIVDTVPLRFSTVLIDSSNVRSKSFVDTVSVKHLAVIAKFMDTVIQAGLNENTTMSLVDSLGNCAKFVWRFGSLQPETTLVNYMVKKFTDTLGTNVSVYGIDRFGYTGNIVKAKIVVKPFDYSLTEVTGSFPSIIIAKHKATWKVTVNNPSKMSTSGGRYFWKFISGGVEIDSSGPLMDTFSAMAGDSVFTTISVQVKDSLGGSSTEHAMPVTVRLFKPSFKFEKATDTTRIGKIYIVKGHYFDTNVDGFVDSVFWDTNGDGKIDLVNRDSSYTFSSPDAIVKTVIAYARDNDGNLSAHDTARIVVKSDKPYFNKATNDTIIFVNTSAQLHASASPGESNVPIAGYTWKLRGALVLDTTTIAATFSKIFQNAGRCTVTVTCKDGDNIVSMNADTFIVTINKGNPIVMGLKPDSVFINAANLFTVTALEINPNGKLDSFYVQWDQGSAFEAKKDSLFQHKYLTVGMKRLRVVAKDNNGFASDTLVDSVYVNLGKPTATGISVDIARTSIFMGASRKFIVKGHDPDGGLDSAIILWNSVNKEAQKTFGDSAVFQHVFAASDTGKRIIKTVVIDVNGISSDTLKDSLYVRLGKPVVDGITPQTIWVNDDTTFTISSHDTNGTVDSLIIDWADGTAQARKGRLDVINHKYSISMAGNKNIKIWAKDNDGNLSDSTLFPVNVQLGKPIVSAITTDTVLSKIFINDPITFTIAYSDPNGMVNAVSIDNGTGVFGAFNNTTGSTYSFGRTFTRSDTGSKMIRAIAKDNDGILSDTFNLLVYIRLGAPVVDSIIPGTVWVRDNNTFTINTHDTNGHVDSFYVDWNNDGIFETKSGTKTVSHMFDTTEAGPQTIRVKVMDNDSIWTTKTLNIQVNMGRPILRGKTFGDSIQWVKGNGIALDTMFYVLTGANTTMQIDTADSNGQCRVFFWDFYSDGSINSITTTPTTTNGFAPNSANPLRVYCKNDDSLTSQPFACIVYPDAPPLVPTLHDAETIDSVTIYWKNKDVHDGDLTQYRVLVHNGATPDSTISQDIISNWKSGYRVSDIGQYDYMFRFKVAHSGTAYDYQVMAKDARGSITPSIIGSFPF